MAAATLRDPYSHYEQVHRTPHGAVIIWESLAPGKRWHRVEPYHPAAALLGPLQGKADVFISVNEFRNWRLIRNLKSLRACYVDLDGCTDWKMALDALLEARMPSPSLMVMSGRGIHFYWILEPVPAQALPVWQRVQDSLVHALAPLGADPRAKDCTRMLRLTGTINGKNGEEAIGRALTGDVWTLHELADEVLGPRPAQHAPARVFDFKAQAARHRKGHRAPRMGGIYQWWHLVYRDLCTIGDYHWLGGVPEGRRDTFLFLMANSLSWFACSDALASEIAKTAKTFTPSLTQRQVETYTRPILRRAADAAAGRKYEWQGREVDPRYAFRSQTIREWLGGEELIAPDIWPDLRALAPPHVIHERRQVRDRVREQTRAARDRVAEGRYADHNTGQGYRVSNEQKRATARLLKAQGRSVRQIAEELGVGKSTVADWLKK